MTILSRFRTNRSLTSTETVEVSEQDHPGPAGPQLLDGRDRRTQAGVVGDLAGVGHGDIEVHPHQGPLALEFRVVERLEGHRA